VSQECSHVEHSFVREHRTHYLFSTRQHPSPHICILVPSRRCPSGSYRFSKKSAKKNDDRRRADRCLPYSVKTGRIELCIYGSKVFLEKPSSRRSAAWPGDPDRGLGFFRNNKSVFFCGKTVRNVRPRQVDGGQR
jgi:hypothetical protein